LREEQRLGVFQNRALGRIFGRKSDEIIGGWENCIMRIHNLLTAANATQATRSRRRTCSTHVKDKKYIESFVGK
jgi:hypothetical protein